MSQIKYFYQDILMMLGKNKWRILIIFFSRVFVGIFWYRFDRALYLLLGSSYRIFRILLSPVFYLAQAYTNLEIHYEADIGPGLLVLHSAVGIVISGKLTAGRNFILTGGNVVGVIKECQRHEFVIGNDCYLGANACVIGPLILGNNITVGACACVVKSFSEDDLTLVGVPAKQLIHS